MKLLAAPSFFIVFPSALMVTFTLLDATLLFGGTTKRYNRCFTPIENYSEWFLRVMK